MQDSDDSRSGEEYRGETLTGTDLGKNAQNQGAASSLEEVFRFPVLIPRREKTGDEKQKEVAEQRLDSNRTIDLGLITPAIRTAMEDDVVEISSFFREESLKSELTEGTVFQADSGTIYKISRQLGEGGQGEVYLAERVTHIRVPVALKRVPLNPEHPRYEQLVESLKQEVQHVMQLSGNKNIALAQALETYRQTFMAEFEFVDGDDLEGIIKKHNKEGQMPMSMPDIVIAQIAWQTLNGLEAAHKLDIIHRDIKPSNIMINKDGEVKITDFGVARTRDMIISQIKSGLVFGTPDFMPPEIIMERTVLQDVLYSTFGIKKEKEAPELLDGRTDIYSLGATMYDALTGFAPNDPDRELMRGLKLYEIGPTIMKMQLRFLVPPEEIVPSVDPMLSEIICRALRADPRRRYQNSTAFRQTLSTFIYPPGIGEGLFVTDVRDYLRGVGDPQFITNHPEVGLKLKRKFDESRRLRHEQRGTGVFARFFGKKTPPVDIWVPRTYSEYAQERIRRKENPARIDFGRFEEDDEYARVVRTIPEWKKYYAAYRRRDF